MSFEYQKYLVIIAPFLILYFFIFKKNDKKFYQWVEDHWFLKRSWSNKVSRVLFFIFIVLLMLSTLDLRGPEEKIETSIPDQKTVILIDKSASMLVEDVRPNRFKKAVMMARHFVKKAAGHQISIIVFSDTHKRVVPFTDDIDLLDSILGGLLGLDINVGGSQLSLAITEATSYFNLGKEYTGGNLLVFTDGEEHNTLENFKLNEDVNLAIVGVGTLNGGPIPLRRTGGGFQGYKKFNGKEINSRLNEENIKDFVNRTKNSKYWISLSYSLPTDEILDFFRLKFQSKLSKGQTRVRPVLVKYIVIPAVLIYLLSFIFSLRRSYVALSLFFALLSYPDYSKAQDKEEPSPQDVKAAMLLNKMKSGDLDETSRLKVAEELLKLNKAKESSTIYQETIKNINKFPNEALLNMGTSLLKSGKIPEALELFEKMKSSNRLSAEEQKVVENNTLKAILNKNQKKQEQKKKEQDEKENKKKDQDDKKDSQGNDKQDNKDQEDKKDKKGKKKEQKNKGGKEGKEKNKKPSDGNEEEDKKNKDKDKKEDENKDKEKNNKEKKKNKSVKDKEEQIKKKRKMVKIPATLKQLMNDDRGLQKRFLKTNIGKDKRSEKRDW